MRCSGESCYVSVNVRESVHWSDECWMDGWMWMGWVKKRCVEGCRKERWLSGRKGGGNPRSVRDCLLRMALHGSWASSHPPTQGDVQLSLQLKRRLLLRRTGLVTDIHVVHMKVIQKSSTCIHLKRRDRLLLIRLELALSLQHTQVHEPC